jgi:predicted nucleic acid-binding protein
MAAILLDTTVIVDVLKGRPRTLARVDALEPSGDTPYICAVTAEEVSSGLRAREREVATELFEGLAVAPLGVSEGRLAGWWRRTHRAKGRTLSQADALIAAAAVGIGARLATGNPKDFQMIDGLVVEQWPVDE